MYPESCPPRPLTNHLRTRRHAAGSWHHADAAGQRPAVGCLGPSGEPTGFGNQTAMAEAVRQTEKGRSSSDGHQPVIVFNCQSTSFPRRCWIACTTSDRRTAVESSPVASCVIVIAAGAGHHGSRTLGPTSLHPDLRPVPGAACRTE